MRDVEQDADTVIGKDLHDVELLGGFVVDLDDGGNLRHALMQQRAPLRGEHQARDINFAGQDLVQIVAKLRPAALRHRHIGVPAMRDTEYVENSPVGGRENACVKNVEV